MSGQVSYRRVYEEVSPSDGTRVLVDRIWPRGIRKDALSEKSPERAIWYC